MKKTLFLFLASCGLSTGMYAGTSCAVDFSQNEIRSESIAGREDVLTGEGVVYNGQYRNSWLMHSPSESFIRVNFEKSENECGRAVLSLTHLASVVNDVAYSPITIRVNNTVIATQFSPASCNYITDTFDITSALADGLNSITITLDYDAPCNYWIQGLTVEVVDEETIQ